MNQRSERFVIIIIKIYAMFSLRQRDRHESLQPNKAKFIVFLNGFI